MDELHVAAVDELHASVASITTVEKLHAGVADVKELKEERSFIASLCSLKGIHHPASSGASQF
jgi:hypothetical protein